MKTESDAEWLGAQINGAQINGARGETNKLRAKKTVPVAKQTSYARKKRRPWRNKQATRETNNRRQKNQEIQTTCSYNERSENELKSKAWAFIRGSPHV
jgi:mannose-6-phosphate isomerase-like protein (cupin superfamily)